MANVAKKLNLGAPLKVRGRTLPARGYSKIIALKDGFVRLLNGNLVNANGDNIAQAATTWANAPAAVGNEGLIVPITGLGGKGSQLFRSDGVRFYPLAGYIDLAVKKTQVSVTAAEANDAGGTIKSTTKIMLPYNANNGSLMQDGDIMHFMYAYEKSGGTIAIRRAISIGTNASAPLSNTTVANATTGASHTSYPEFGAFYRKSATSVCMTGRKTLDGWGGSSAANTYDDAADAATIASSMDTNNMYVDFSLAFATNGAETAYQSFMWVRLYCSGPFND